jgi:MFS transporter, DHA2 family, multidrug resistance protein
MGIAAVTTLVARREQVHTNVLGGHVTALSPVAHTTLEQLRAMFIARGADAVTATQRAYGAAFGMVEQQSAVLSFVEAFWLLGVIFLAVLPLILLMKRPRHGRAIVGH